MRQMLTYITAEPFRSFRIKMADGRTDDIPDPDMIMVGHTTVHISTWMSEADEPGQKLPLDSIEPVELLESSVQ